MRLRDKRCVIVGGTTGIGLAAARRFLEEGARVVVAGRSPDKGAEAQQALQALGPARFLPCDASVSSQVDVLFAGAEDFLGGIDVLYHVAGISGRRFGDGPLHECSDDGWHATVDANLTSTFLTNRAALRHFLAHRRAGVILNMASVLGWSPAPRHFDTAAYAATKGGILALTRLAAARYAPDGIRVNALAPALVDTPMATRAVQDAEIRRFLEAKQPLCAGPISPEECTGAAVYLCSDEARAVTGVVLPVDGGWCVSG